MTTTGPSKEELQNYYNNNRQYFDELAKYYKEIDPKYYQQYIAPFYSPFARVSTGGKPVKAMAVVMVAIALLGVGITAAVVFFVNGEKYNSPSNLYNEPSKKVNAPYDSITTEEPPKPQDPIRPERKDKQRNIQRNR